MPELPDVEIFRRRLARTSLHRRIERVQVRDQRMLRRAGRSHVEEVLRGQRMESTHRHGKHLLVGLSDEGVLALHFGMTGYLVAGDGTPSVEEHTRLVIEFGDGRCLRLVDQRRLASVALAESVEDFVARKRLGPDVLTLGSRDFRDLLQQGRGSVKGILMNQQRVAGLGNIYSDEVLFQARVNPRAEAARLDGAACSRLHRQVRRVADLATERGADPARLPRTWLLPSRQDGEPCPRQRGTVRRYTSNGRAGYYCPTCQPA